MSTLKIPRAVKLPGAGRKPRAVSESASLVDFLAAMQQHDVSFLPVSYQVGREILGRGLSGSIYQAAADSGTAFAFKQGVPLRHERDDDKEQSWYSLVTEITALQHPPIRDSHHVIDLLGVSFSVDGAPGGRATAWPMLVTLRANMGDLGTVLTGTRWPLTPELRWQLLVEVAEAVYLLHSCGVAHGDIKPNNFLVEQQDDEINCRLIDFGSCVINGQHRFPTWNPPWNPPELGIGGVSHAVGFEQLSQADLFALGLLCVHILLPLECLRDAGICCLREDQSDEQWEQIILRLQALSFDTKSPGYESDLLGSRLVQTISQADMDEERKAFLEGIVRNTVCLSSGGRTMPWDEVFRLGKDQLSVGFKTGPYSTVELPRLDSSSMSVGHNMHTPFDLGCLLGELDDTDYVVRHTIFRDIQHKAKSSACPECRRHYGFHLAVSCEMGLGGNKDDDAKAKWLQKIGKSQSDIDLTIGGISKIYNGTNKVSQHVLERLGIGVLQTSDRPMAYQASGRLAEAEACLKKEIDARGQVFGPKHPCLARLQGELVQVFRREGRLEDASDYQQRLVDVLSREYGTDHPSAIMARITIADIWTDQGLLRKAEAIMRDDVPLLGKPEVLGPEHPDVIVAMHLQANMKAAAGDLDGAETILRQVISLRDRVLGPEHPLTVNSELSLVTLLRGRGQFTAASKLLERIEDKLQSVLEGDQLREVNFYVAQALLYKDLWMLDKAMERARRARVAIDRMKLDADDSLMVLAKETEAKIHHAANEWALEERLLREILAASHSGDYTNRTLNTMTLVLLARNLVWQGQNELAYATAEEAIKSLGPSPLLADPFSYVASVAITADALKGQGKQDAAEERLQRVYESCVREFGEGHLASVEAADELGEFWSDRGQYEKSQRHFEPILESLRPNHGTLAIQVARKLAVVYRERGLFDRAVELCHEAASWALEAGGDSLPDTLAIQNILGSVYIQLGRLDEADALLSRIDSECHEARVGSYIKNNLRKLRKAQDRMEEALELSRQAQALMPSATHGVTSESLILEGNVLSDRLAAHGLSEALETDILENLRQREQVQGARHLGRIAAMADLAYAYGESNRLDDAERLFGEIEQLGGMNDREHPMHCATMLAKRADVCFRLGRLDEAEALERRALEIRERMYAAEHTAVLTNKANLASTLNALGRHTDAEPLLRDVLAGRLRHAAEQGTAVVRIARAQRDLASVLYFQGKLEESVALFEDALEASMAAGLSGMVANLEASVQVVQQQMEERSRDEDSGVARDGDGGGGGGDSEEGAKSGGHYDGSEAAEASEQA